MYNLVVFNSNNRFSSKYIKTLVRRYSKLPLVQYCLDFQKCMYSHKNIGDFIYNWVGRSVKYGKLPSRDYYDFDYNKSKKCFKDFDIKIPENLLYSQDVRDILICRYMCNSNLDIYELYDLSNKMMLFHLRSDLFKMFGDVKHLKGLEGSMYDYNFEYKAFPDWDMHVTGLCSLNLPRVRSKFLFYNNYLFKRFIFLPSIFYTFLYGINNCNKRYYNFCRSFVKDYNKQITWRHFKRDWVMFIVFLNIFRFSLNRFKALSYYKNSCCNVEYYSKECLNVLSYSRFNFNPEDTKSNESALSYFSSIYGRYYNHYYINSVNLRLSCSNLGLDYEFLINNYCSDLIKEISIQSKYQHRFNNRLTGLSGYTKVNSSWDSKRCMRFKCRLICEIFNKFNFIKNRPYIQLYCNDGIVLIDLSWFMFKFWREFRMLRRARYLKRYLRLLPFNERFGFF